MSPETLAIMLHVLAALVWVGGMFFAHVIARPVLASLAPDLRLAIWRGVFGRFFPWVWGAIGLLLATGYWIVFSYMGGFGGTGVHVNVMHGVGWLMIFLFLALFFGPYQAFDRALAVEDLEGAASAQVWIRRIMVVNLGLGLLTAAIGSVGGYWF